MILDLCAGSGAWSQPYLEAGYDVRRITLPEDVRQVRYLGSVHGIMAAPPCTVFANSGARWPRSTAAVQEALSVVDACLRFVWTPACGSWSRLSPLGGRSRIPWAG